MSTHKHKDPIVHEHGISGYDKKDVIGSKLARAFALLTVTTIASALIALWSWKSWEYKQSSSEVAVLPVAEERALPALPRLQPMPGIDIKALRAAENDKLTRYAWIDKQAQIVQIPVGRALDIIAEKGLPYGREAHVPGQGQAGQTTPAASASVAPAAGL